MDQFEKVLKEGYSFEMGKYFDEGWKIFSKGALHLIIYALVFLIIYFIVGSIPYINLLSSFVLYPLVAGTFIYFRNLEKGRKEFGDLFSGFNHFGQIAIYIFLLFIFSIPFIALTFSFIIPYDLIPEILEGDYSNYENLGYEMAQNITENFGLFMTSIIIILLGSIYLYTSYMFVLPLIVDSKLGFWQAMETSRKVVAKNFFIFFLFGLLLMIMFFVGVVFTCGMGYFVMFPFLTSITYSAYNNILQPTQSDLATQISSFGQSTRDINTESEDNL